VDSWTPSLGQAYRVLRDQRAASSPAIPTPFGFSLAGNTALANGSFERAEAALFIDHLRRAEVCVDIGANIGLYSCLAATQSKHVIAVEPLSSNLRLLYRNLAENDFRDVEVFPMGLSSESGIKQLFGGGTGASFVKGWAGASDRFYNAVPVTTLDVILSSRFEGSDILIKMDVEGFEREVLKGAERTLCLNPKPSWLIEICLDENFQGRTNDKFYETFEVFWLREYRAAVADGQGRSVEPQDVNRWAKQGHVDFGSHNYFFRGVSTHS
jgi:FkbM family methyltransferase